MSEAAGQPPDESIVFDRAADYYDTTRGFPPGVDLEVAAFMAKVAEITPEHTMLEIGVGTGRIAIPLAAYTGLFVGIDLSGRMMSVMDTKQQGSSNPVRAVQGDVMWLPLPDDSIDRAVAVHILHLIPDATQALRELARVLRPDGLVMHCWNHFETDGFDPLWSAWRQATERLAPPDTRWKVARTIFEDQGWKQAGETHIYSYPLERTAEAVVARFRSRQLSSTWLLPDEAWKAGVEAVEAALRQHFNDPHQPIVSQASFHIQIYAPPD
jgi:ubiquinone/menaquinone biosynthesis C-methylase UbiE